MPRHRGLAHLQVSPSPYRQPWLAVGPNPLPGTELPYSSGLFHLYLFHRLADWHGRAKPDPDCRCLFTVLRSRSVVQTFRYRALFPGCCNYRRNPKLRHHSGRRNRLAWIPRARVSQTLFIHSDRCSLRRNLGLVACAHHRLRRLQRGNWLVWFGPCLRQHDRPVLRPDMAAPEVRQLMDRSYSARLSQPLHPTVLRPHDRVH